METVIVEERKRLTKKIRILDVVIGVLLVFALIVLIIDITKFTSGFSDFFSRFGTVFDWPAYPTMPANQLIANFGVMVMIIVGIVTTIGIVIAMIYRRYVLRGLFYIGLNFLFGLAVIAYLVSYSSVWQRGYEGLLVGANALAIILTIVLSLLVLLMGLLLYWLIRRLFLFDLKDITKTKQTVIINNYYGTEKTIVKEIVHTYVEEDEAMLEPIEETIVEEEPVEEVVEEIIVIDEDVVVEEITINKTSYERKPFVQQLAESQQDVKNMYNELKAEFLTFGIKSRISKGGDTFRLHTKAYARIKVAGKGLKIYYALNPRSYEDSTYPIKDSGNQKIYVDIPLTFKVKSKLSVRRAKELIAQACAIDGLVEQEDIELHTYDWSSDAILNHYNDIDELEDVE